MTRHRTACSAPLLLGALLLACAAPAPPEPAPEPEDIGDKLLAVEALPLPRGFDIEQDRVYYTRVGMWYEHGVHVSTNYRRGTFVPVNTRVTLRVEPADHTQEAFLYVRLAGTRKHFKLKNVRHHSKTSFPTLVFRTFATQPLSLEGLDDATRRSVLAGRLAAGMTRFQVLLTRGYPPAHETPDLLAPTWRYWRSRFDSERIHFEDGRLVEKQTPLGEI